MKNYARVIFKGHYIVTDFRHLIDVLTEDYVRVEHLHLLESEFESLLEFQGG